MEEKNKKPKVFFILKVLGFIFVPIGIAGAVLSFSNFGNFNNDYFMIGGIIATLGFFIGLSCLIIGFSLDMKRLSIKTAKYITDTNKEDVRDIVNTAVDIGGEAVTKTIKAVKSGLKDSKYCKYCGAEIDNDSAFCKECGKEQ